MGTVASVVTGFFTVEATNLGRAFISVDVVPLISVLLLVVAIVVITARFIGLATSVRTVTSVMSNLAANLTATIIWHLIVVDQNFAVDEVLHIQVAGHGTFGRGGKVSACTTQYTQYICRHLARNPTTQVVAQHEGILDADCFCRPLLLKNGQWVFLANTDYLLAKVKLGRVEVEQTNPQVTHRLRVLATPVPKRT